MAHILVIDDDKDILRLLEFSLKRAGHTVSTCVDGIEGIEQAEAQNPDLIVCDIMMPRMTGYEFCRQARANPVLEKTPIIIFSARFQPVDRQTALDAGATDYISKATSPDVLVSRIAELVPTSAPATTGHMIALFSLRGGTGVTSLAVNLAIALALAKKTKVGLVDLATLGGHAAVMLGLRPTSNVAQVLSTAGSDFTPDLMKPHFMPHDSGVQLLASTSTFDQRVLPADDSLLKMISSIKTTFPITVLDIPHLLEPHFSPILQLIDRTFLVLSPDMPSLQSTAIALQALIKMGVTDQKITLVVNQVNPYNALSVETIQKAIKRPILATIPFEPNMTKAVNSAKPLLVDSPQSTGVAAIGKLASTILNQM